MRGFTKTGQPIQGRKYILRQEGVGLPDDRIEVVCVGKAYGKGGNADLVSVMLEEPSGARDWFPWPIEASDGATPITFRAAE
jgi:hypothetical protein